MSRIAQENIVAVILLVLFGGVVYLCQDFGPRARMVPLPLAIFGIVLTLIQIVWQNWRSTDELHMDLIAVARPAQGEAQEAAPEGGRAGDKRSTWQREAVAFGIVAFLIALVYTLGVIPAVFVFTGSYFLVTRHYGWLAGFAYTSLLTVVIYVLFIVALQVQPYHGLLEPLVERYF